MGAGGGGEAKGAKWLIGMEIDFQEIGYRCRLTGCVLREAGLETIPGS
jgi:hypothetical protein